MNTVAEILAAIKELSLEERDEVELYLRQCMAKDFQKAADEKPSERIDAKTIRS